MIAVGQTIGNYMLTAKLGEGGMGVVYLAEHPVIGRKAAMKAIHPELSRNPEVVSRFVTEAKAVNQIGNEHIVDIHDFGTTPDGEFYFIMEFLQGEALSDQLKRSAPLMPARALGIAAQVADALGASHQHGIIHRDLKPENIFLITKGHTQDFVKVLDFGLAKLTQGDDKVSHKTRTGSVMGTPYYMAPEQCEGKASIDHRADIYSLGIILYEMLTARVPFGGEGYGEIIVKHITAPVPPLRAINPMLPAALEAITLRALAKRPEDRFQTMEEFAEALLDPERYAAAAPAVSAPVPATARTALMEPAGAKPLGRADSVASGQVLFGNPQTQVGAQAGPMPSTFRHAAGEMAAAGSDEYEAAYAPPRSRKVLAIVAAALGGMLAAGFAAYYVTQREQPVVTRKPVAAVVRPAPPKPRQVVLTFKSDPSGAVVLRQDTHEQLGITPFHVAFPTGNAPVHFLFKKDAFRQEVEAFTPAESGEIAVALVALPPQPAAAAPASKPEKKAVSRARSSVHHRSRPHRHARGQPFDEDGVLAPSF